MHFLYKILPLKFLPKSKLMRNFYVTLKKRVLSLLSISKGMLFQQSQTQHYQRGIYFHETPADMMTRSIGPMPMVPNQAL